MEDNSIVELYLGRDEDAIAQTAQKYGARLRSLSFGIVRDAQTAEECENDTYLEAWNTIPPHRPHEYFYAYLARITRHISLNRCRDRERLKRRAHVCELSAELGQCLASDDDVAGEVALRESLNLFLSSLDSQKRCIFVRRYWYMDSIADIADRYGLTKGQVKTTLFRCREQLRERLRTDGFSV